MGKGLENVQAHQGRPVSSGRRDKGLVHVDNIEFGRHQHERCRGQIEDGLKINSLLSRHAFDSKRLWAILPLSFNDICYIYRAAKEKQGTSARFAKDLNPEV